MTCDCGGTALILLPAAGGNKRFRGGVVAAPGMYLMGMPFLRRRKSSLIDGAAQDARDLSDHLSSYLDGGVAIAAE